MNTKRREVLVIICVLILHLALARFKFTNIKCEALDKTFVNFENCFIKAANRSYKTISVKVNLYKLPLTNIIVNYGIYRRDKVYKPFKHIGTIDACKFLQRSSKNIFLNYMFEFLRKYSNMNHTCPYNHDIIWSVESSFFNNYMRDVMPWPTGEYAMYSTWQAYNVTRADVRIQFSIKNHH